MLPIILGLIGGGFLVSAFSEDKKYAKGGSIPNNYKGKTAEEVWDEWTVDQREHFLKDHNLFNTKADPTMTSKELKEYDGKAVEWGSDLKNKLEIHIEEGQYAKGGMMAKGGSFKDRSENDSIKLAKEWQKVLDSNFDDKVYEKYKKIVKETQIPKDELRKIEDYISTTPKGKRRDIDIYRYWGVDKMADGGTMAKGGVLKEEDYVWNAVGKKLIVDKVTDDEYYLTSFGQSSASPFSKKKVDGYIKSGEWSLKPKKDMMSKGETKKETMIKKSSGTKKANAQTNKLKEVIAHAKATRKDGEAWKVAVARAWKEMK
jgi:hypothetical protein